MKTINLRILKRLQPFIIAYRLSGHQIDIYTINTGLSIHILKDHLWYNYIIRGIGKDMVILEDITAGNWAETMTYKKAVDTIVSDVLEPC